MRKQRYKNNKAKNIEPLPEPDYSVENIDPYQYERILEKEEYAYLAWWESVNKD